MPQSHIHLALHFLAVRRVQRCTFEQRAELGECRDGGLLAGVDDCDAEVWWGEGGLFDWRGGFVDVEDYAKGGCCGEGVALWDEGGIVPGD